MRKPEIETNIVNGNIQCIRGGLSRVWDEAWILLLLALMTGLMVTGVELCRPSLSHTLSVVRFGAIAVILAVLPGCALVRWLSLTVHGFLLNVLLRLLLSLALSVAGLFLAYFAGVYTPVTLYAWLAFWAVAGPWALRHASPLKGMGAIRDAWQRQGNVERVAIAVVTLVLLGHFHAAVFQPFMWPDAVVSWDKWGCDMAERHGLGTYLMGGYPQFLPTLYSAFYKAAGTFMTSLPHEQFLLHGFGIGFTALLVISVIVISCEAGAFWPLALALLLGNSLLSHWLISGYADIPALSLGLGALAVAWTFVNGRWSARTPKVAGGVMALALFAAGFSKATGVLWVVGILGGLAWVTAQDSSRRTRLAATLAMCVLLTVLLLAPFYLHQAFLNWRPELVESDPHWHMFRIHPARQDLYALTLGHLMERAADFAGSYALGPTDGLRYYVPGSLLLLLLVGVVYRWRRAALLLLCGSLVFTLLWLPTTGYDWRNAFPVLALFAIGAAGGLPAAGDATAGRILAARGIAAFLALLFGWHTLVVALPEVRDAFIYGRGGAVWASRPESRLAMINPPWDRLRRFLGSLPQSREASHIYCPDAFYRHLGRRGIFKLQDNWNRDLTPGDVLLEPNLIWKKRQNFNPICSLKGMGYARLSVYQPELQQTP